MSVGKGTVSFHVFNSSLGALTLCYSRLPCSQCCISWFNDTYMSRNLPNLHAQTALKSCKERKDNMSNMLN